jgi:predicted AlkP superfamily pyrophosphatase or phosphodiesterase
MKKILALFLVLSATISYSQSAKPKLVVGVVVDMMRYEYLDRYKAHYGEGGFLRLMNNGFNCRNLHINYVPTMTAAGHSAIFTGTTPRFNGIIGNDWFDRKAGRMRYCVEDRSVKSVGVENASAQMSPRSMLSTTIADQLKLHNVGRGKSIGISLKDRGAILPAGHSAEAAYWFSDGWVTSSYYMEELPSWVQKFNKTISKYMPEKWETLRPIDTYVESFTDDNAFEGKLAGQEKPVFPHDIKKLAADNGNLSLLMMLPQGSTMTTDFAKATILNEKLGMGAHTDFLSVSYSSADNTGHMYGPHSKEMQDSYVRMDGEIAELLSFLDREIGPGEYLLFLTSDHGANDVPAYLNSQKIPAGIADDKLMFKASQDFLKERFGIENAILKYYNEQFYLDHELIRASSNDLEQVSRALAHFVLQFEGVAETHSTYDLMRAEFTEGLMGRVQRGINMQRSGDVLVIYQPSWMKYGIVGTHHGSGYSYDTHIPALFFGWNVKQGYSDKALSVTDIAPTVCTMLGISFPNATQGRPIEEVLRK